MELRFVDETDGTTIAPVRHLTVEQPSIVATVPAGRDAQLLIATDGAGELVEDLVPFRLAAGQDRRIDLCGGVSLSADRTSLRPHGDETTVTATIEACAAGLVDSIAGVPVTFTVEPDGPTHASLRDPDGWTDDAGRAAATFVTGSAQARYEVRVVAAVPQDDGTVLELAASIPIVVGAAYDYEVVATAGPDAAYSWLGSGPAVTADGTVAFTGRPTGGRDEVVVVTPDGTQDVRSHLWDEPDVQLSGEVSLTGDGAAITRGFRRVESIGEWTWIHRWAPGVGGIPEELARGHLTWNLTEPEVDDFRWVGVPGVNAAGDAVFEVSHHDDQTAVRLAQATADGAVDVGEHPVGFMSVDDTAVWPAHASDGTTAALVAFMTQGQLDDGVWVGPGVLDDDFAVLSRASEGWYSGRRVAISEAGDVVVFAAEVAGVNGVYAALRDPQSGTWGAPQPVVREGEPAGLGTTADGTPITFEDLAVDRTIPVAVHHERSGVPNFDGDTLVVAFGGVPDARGERVTDTFGLWTTRLTIVDEGDDAATDLRLQLRGTTPVLQVGDRAPEQGGTVQALQWHRPLVGATHLGRQPVPEDHRLALRVRTEDGWQVVRATWAGHTQPDVVPTTTVEPTGGTASTLAEPLAEPMSLSVPLEVARTDADDVATTSTTSQPARAAVLPAFVIDDLTPTAGAAVDLHNRSRGFDGEPAEVVVDAGGAAPIVIDADGSAPVEFTDAGDHAVAVTAADPTGASLTAVVTVTVESAPNTPPVADAGPPVELPIGDDLVLDASASFDPDEGDRLVAFDWDLTGDGAFEDASGAVVGPLAFGEVEALLCGGTCEVGASYLASVRVTDGRGATDTASTTVTFVEVAPPPHAGLRSEFVATFDSMSNLRPFDGAVYFLGRPASTDPMRLWRTEGTPGTTRRVFSSGEFETVGGNMTVVGDRFFATGTHPDHGLSMFVSDGTTAGTEVVPLPGLSRLSDVTAVGDHGVLFVAWDGSQYEPWFSDGTTSGTRILDLRPGGSSNPRDLTVVGDRTFLTADRGRFQRELWVTDGTPAGTRMVTALSSDEHDAFVAMLVAAGDRVFFRANDGIHGTEMWVSDGTQDGTRMVVDLVSSANGSRPIPMGAVGDRVLFGASPSGCLRDCDDRLVYVTDGTEAGTEPISPGSRYDNDVELSNLAQVGDLAYYRVNTGDGQWQLWRTDGTADGSRRVFSHEATAALALRADGLRTRDDAHLYAWNLNGRLFLTDGTVRGTVALPSEPEDIRQINSYYDASAPVVVNGALVFHAQVGGSTLRGLWRVAADPPAWSDGAELTATPTGGGGVLLEWDAAQHPIGVHGYRVFVDGRRVEDLDGATTSTTLELPDPQAEVVVTVQALHGLGDWSEDGPSVVVDPYAEPPGYDGPLRGLATELVREFAAAGQFTEHDGAVYFFGRETFTGPAGLWRTEGTPGSTRLVLPHGVTRLMSTGDQLFFHATHPDLGVQLFSSDGTAEGTRVLPINGSGDTQFRDFVAFGDGILFPAWDGTRWELWASDGTSEGTRLVVDLRPGSSSWPRELTVVGDHVYFAANAAGSTGHQLWVTDGTAAGTRLVQEIRPGGDPQVSGLTAVGDRLYFRAHDDDHGQELWVTGPGISTSLVADLVPGTGSSRPVDPAALGDKVVFQASPVSCTTVCSQRQVYVHDPTMSEPQPLGPGTASVGYAEQWTPTVVGDVLYYRIRTDAWELWRTDGTLEGTWRVSGPESRLVDGFPPIEGMAALDDDWLYAWWGTNVGSGAADGLWITDGTAGSTWQVPSDPAGLRGANPNAIAVHGALVFHGWLPNSTSVGLWRVSGGGPSWPDDATLRATTTDDGDVVLDWDPADHPIGVHAYRVRIDGQQYAQVAGDVTTLTLTSADLDLDGPVAVTVEAGHGFGDWSDGGPSMTLEPPDDPAAPVPAATGGDAALVDAALRFSWQLPDDPPPDGSTRAVRVQLFDGDDPVHDPVLTDGVDTTEVSYDPAEHGWDDGSHLLRLDVTVLHVPEGGDPADAVSSEPLGITFRWLPAGAPQDVVVAVTDPRQGEIEVAFSGADLSGTDLQVTGYEAVVTPVGGDEPAATSSGPSGPLTFTGLAPGEHEVALVALSRAGAGPAVVRTVTIPATGELAVAVVGFDAEGPPVADAEVVLLDAADVEVARARTDEHGEAVLGGVLPGPHVVEVAADRYLDASVEVTIGDEGTAVSVTLSPVCLAAMVGDGVLEAELCGPGIPVVEVTDDMDAPADDDLDDGWVATAMSPTVRITVPDDVRLTFPARICLVPDREATATVVLTHRDGDGVLMELVDAEADDAGRWCAEVASLSSFALFELTPAEEPEEPEEPGDGPPRPTPPGDPGAGPPDDVTPGRPDDRPPAGPPDDRPSPGPPDDRPAPGPPADRPAPGAGGRPADDQPGQRVLDAAGRLWSALVSLLGIGPAQP